MELKNGKFVPVPHEGVLGEWMYSSTHSLTSALDGGECRLHAPTALLPGKEPLLPVG
jgi:hypothetical protein